MIECSHTNYCHHLIALVLLTSISLPYWEGNYTCRIPLLVLPSFCLHAASGFSHNKESCVSMKHGTIPHVPFTSILCTCTESKSLSERSSYRLALSFLNGLTTSTSFLRYCEPLVTGMIWRLEDVQTASDVANTLSLARHRSMHLLLSTGVSELSSYQHQQNIIIHLPAFCEVVNPPSALYDVA